MMETSWRPCVLHGERLGHALDGILFCFPYYAFGLVFNTVQATLLQMQCTMHLDGKKPTSELQLFYYRQWSFLRDKTYCTCSEFIVPIVALAYLVLALFVMFANIEKLPAILALL